MFVILWVNFFSPRVKKWSLGRTLNNPCDVYIVVEDEHGDTHWVTESTGPPNSNLHIEFRIIPRLVFDQRHFLFGFPGDLAEVPLPQYVSNKFVERGAHKKIIPGQDDDHFIDKKGQYHILTQKARSPIQTEALGFVIKSQAPGKFVARIVFESDLRDATPRTPINLRVTDEPADLVRCHKEEHKNCRVASIAAPP